MAADNVRTFLMSPKLYTPSFPLVRWVVRGVGHVMSPHFFQHGLRLNAVGYTKMIDTVVKLWIGHGCHGRPYVFQQDFQHWHTKLG